MGLGYNKNILYPRPITLAKRYLQFIYIMGLKCLIKLASVLYINDLLTVVKLFTQ